MKTIATSLAVVLLSASSIAIAQEGPKGPGGAGPGGGGGPSLERGGGGPAGGPGGGGPGGAMMERGGDAGPAGGAAGRAVERATEGRPERAERSEAPASEERRAKSNDDGPSERRASKRDDAPRQERKASDEEKSEKRARTAEDSNASDKADRAANKADDKKDKADAKADTTVRDAKQAETDPSSGKDEAKKQAETKPSNDKPAKQVDLTEAKRDTLRGAFQKEKDLKPRAQVDVDISIGRRLPRGWDYRPVPVAVIEIVPEYRDYVFVYADDDYVICDPDTYEVVAVIPAGGPRYAGGSSNSGAQDRCPARLTLSRDERELILDEVRMKDEVDVRDLEVGWSVPSNVKLQRFPDEVISKADELGGCRYFVARDQLAIVDPIDEKVIFVMDRS